MDDNIQLLKSTNMKSHFQFQHIDASKICASYVKNYLRNNMCQYCFSNISILNIGIYVTNELGKDKMIAILANSKIKKINFFQLNTHF